LSRTVKRSPKRWTHPIYKNAYVYDYNGIAYTCVFRKRRSTHIKFKESAKYQIMDVLNKRISYALNGMPEEEEIKYDVKSLILRFQKDRVSKLDDKTQYAYKLLYKEFLSENMPLDSKKLKYHILDVVAKSNNVNSTIRGKLQRVMTIFNYGLELEMIDKNPVTRAMLPINKARKIVIYSNDQVNLIINKLNSSNQHECALFVEFALHTAMRISEIINLEWNNVKDDYLLFTGKGNRDRFIPITPFPRLREILSELKILNAKKPFSWKTRVSPASIMRNVLNELKIEYPDLSWDITFHSFRKIAINKWRDAHIDPDIRNQVAGHTNAIAHKNYLTDANVDLVIQEFKKIQNG
jgi:integrase